MRTIKISQRARLLALMVGILALGVLAQSVVINSYVVNDFRKLEENQVRSNARLINLWLDVFLQPLDKLARAAGNWEINRTTLDDANRKAWQQYLQAVYRRDPVFDSAALIAPDGRVLHALAINPESMTAGPLLKSTAQLLQRHAGAHRFATREVLSGWMATPQGLFASASHPVGPAAAPRAYIVVGRYFGNSHILMLQDLGGVSIMLPVLNAGDAEPFQAGDTVGELHRYSKTNNNLELCNTLTPALNPKRALLCVQLQDSIAMHGKASADDLRLATIGGFLLLILTVWIFLDRALLHRLHKLVIHLAATRSDGIAPLEQALLEDSRRQDELGQLSGGMGQLLTRVREVETEQRHLQARLGREKERLTVILSSIQDGIVSVDARGQVNYLNNAAEQMIGQTGPAALGKPLEQVVVLTDSRNRETLSVAALDTPAAGASTTLAEVETTGGSRRQVQVRALPMRAEDGADRPGAVIVLRDVSELHRLTQTLEYQASHDELTGLTNRREFNARLQASLEACRANGAPYALCYIDLDQFKTVNDICGHHAGDLLLQKITATLQKHARTTDTLARLGGDEFALLMADCPAEQAVERANQMRGAVSEVRFTWSGRSFAVDASIGIAMLNQVEGNMDEALSLADATCYVAKSQGRNQVRIYRPGDVDLQNEFGQMRWAQRLKDALDNNEFRLHQQGIHGLSPRSPKTAACEVLLRLREPDGGMIPAEAFIKAAERYQMMPDLDRWVVENVLAHMRMARAAPSACAGGPVSFSMTPAALAPRTYFVNLSGHSLGDESFHAFLIEALGKDSGLAPHLVFEVTETAVISNLPKARKLMAQLRARGCGFALDDFGTGLSSFAYLKELQVQYLKIAGPFVQNMAESALDQVIVRNFSNFGRQLGLLTIAEGVGNLEALHLLRRLRVDYGQGYALDIPAPLDLKPPQALPALNRSVMAPRSALPPRNSPPNLGRNSNVN